MGDFEKYIKYEQPIEEKVIDLIDEEIAKLPKHVNQHGVEVLLCNRLISYCTGLFIGRSMIKGKYSSSKDFKKATEFGELKQILFESVADGIKYAIKTNSHVESVMKGCDE